MPTRYQQFKSALDMIGINYDEFIYSASYTEFFRSPKEWEGNRCIYVGATHYVFQDNGDFYGHAFIYGEGGNAAWEHGTYAQ